jgi:thiamine-monophosphate kinase
VGIGDDGAVVELPGGTPVVLTTDSVVEGVHFEQGTEPALAGRKAAARGVSDVAAMAARPFCSVGAITFPGGWDEAECREVSRGLFEACREFSAPLVGGDLASGGERLTISVTVLGIPGPKGPVLRSGAQVGDAVCVTGRLGGSIRGRHLTFRPRVEEALALAEGFDLHAMIDISDGLSTDALHLAEASGQGLLLRAERIPLSGEAAALARQTGREPLWHALNDGEDYELLFCLPPRQAADLEETGICEVGVTIVGEVIEGGGSFLEGPGGRREPLEPGGWEHMR